MAQFTEVMRQVRRMCESFGYGHCSECPIGDANALECGITVTSGMDCEEVERRVMQWAEEHPEPVYPTWREWQKSVFPDADGRISPCEFGSKDRFNCADNIGELTKKMAQLKANQPRWISVEERLPEENGKYIVCTTKGSVYCTKFSIGVRGSFHTDLNTHITHWMPLPEPPKEAK